MSGGRRKKAGGQEAARGRGLGDFDNGQGNRPTRDDQSRGVFMPVRKRWKEEQKRECGVFGCGQGLRGRERK